MLRQSSLIKGIRSGWADCFTNKVSAQLSTAHTSHTRRATADRTLGKGAMETFGKSKHLAKVQHVPICWPNSPVRFPGFLIVGGSPFFLVGPNAQQIQLDFPRKHFLISRTIRDSNHHNTSFSHSAISSFRMCRIWNMKQKGQLYASKWHNRMWLRQLSHTQKNPSFVCQFQEEQKEAVYNHEDSHDFKIH